MKYLTQIALSIIGLSSLFATTLQAHSHAFKPAFVDTLIEPYLQIQKGLANDDLKATQNGAQQFLKAMAKAPQSEDATATNATLTTPAQKITAADDIQTARAAFLNLSNQLKTLIQHVGTSGKTNLFVARCPMAFEGKGGDWIQSDKMISNPYYGSKMLHCGNIQEQIAEAKTDDHSSHNH